MKIAVLRERRPHENRVAATPETVKKFIALGFEVAVESNAGAAAGITNQAFSDAGAKITKTALRTCEAADIVIKIQHPMEANEAADEVSQLPSGSYLLCHMNARNNVALISTLTAAGVNPIALELVPRITRAQSMDILSSQANIAGYKSVLDALEEYNRAVPMMMTAAGTVAPARVLIMGTGVAGLQAIATAKRLGAIVSATDVRPATKEQVESLGATFIAVEDDEFFEAQTEAGYAKAMSENYQKKQAALIAETITKQDIIITTALIPGRPAPRLISHAMTQTMKEGAVIVDMAIETGGNVEGSKYNETIKVGPVTIIGNANIASRIAQTTSELFARNIYNFIDALYDINHHKKAGKPIDLKDEIIRATLLAFNGKIIHPDFGGTLEEPAAETITQATDTAVIEDANIKADDGSSNPTNDKLGQSDKADYDTNQNDIDKNIV